MNFYCIYLDWYFYIIYYTIIACFFKQADSFCRINKVIIIIIIIIIFYVFVLFFHLTL